MKKWLKGIIYIFIVVSGVLAGSGLLLMDSTLRNVINPVLMNEAPPEAESLKGMAMRIRAPKDEGFAHGLYLETPDSSFVVLYCHDLNGHLYHRLEMLRRFQALGLSVLALDFRGFGLSDPVEISDESFHTDMKKAYDSLRRHQWSSSQIIVYGQGLSAGIQGELLSETQCAAWIMDNPLPSLQDTTSNPIRRFLTVDRLSAYDALASFRGPVMVCYDNRVTDSSITDPLKQARPDMMMCACEGERTRERMDTVDWNAWNACMTELLKQIDAPPTPAPRVFGKKENGEKP